MTLAMRSSVLVSSSTLHFSAVRFVVHVQFVLPTYFPSYKIPADGKLSTMTDVHLDSDVSLTV